MSTAFTALRPRRCRAAIFTCAAAGMLGMLAGCGGGPPSKNVRSVGGQRVETQRQQDAFETVKTPEINAETHFAAGRLAESQDSAARAIEQYRKALTKDPNHTSALYRLGVLHSKQHQYAEAVGAWNRYVQATNGDAAAYANLGFTYELAGRHDDAEAAYLKGIKRDPASAPCRVNYGLLLARKNRISEATLQLQTVLSESQVHYNLASVYEWMGRKEQARLEYQKALQLEPHMKEAQVRLDALQ